VNPRPSGISALAEDMPYAVWLLRGEAGEVLWANTAAEQWLGRSNRTQKSQNLSDILKLPPDVLRAYTRCRETESPVIIRDCRLELDDKRQEASAYHLSFFPCQNHIGLQVQSVAVNNHGNAANLDAMSAMGRILAHEIKNPLAGMSGAVQLRLRNSMIHLCRP